MSMAVPKATSYENSGFAFIYMFLHLAVLQGTGHLLHLHSWARFARGKLSVAIFAQLLAFGWTYLEEQVSPYYF